MRPLVSLLVGGLAVTVSLALGCGGSGGSPGASDGGSDADATSAADGEGDELTAPSNSDAACAVSCPGQEPQAGAACTTACEYTVDSGPGCTRLHECASNQFTAGQPQCKPLLGAGCPATVAGIEAGVGCNANDPPCEYGREICQCSVLSIGADASTEWVCFTVEPDCPAQAPLEGTACSPEGYACSYGGNACAARGFGFYRCNCGVWTALPPPPCI